MKCKGLRETTKSERGGVGKGLKCTKMRVPTVAGGMNARVGATQSQGERSYRYVNQSDGVQGEKGSWRERNRRKGVKAREHT